MRSRSASAAALYQSPPGRHAGVLADRKPQLGEDRALDLGQRQLVDRLAQRRIVRPDSFLGFLPATRRSLRLRLTTKIRALPDNRNAVTMLCTALA